MKAKFYSAAILIFVFAFFNKSNAQSANTNLSNLTSPTKVNVDLLPDRDSKRNLGSGTRGWKNLYLDSAVYIDSSRFIAFGTGVGGGNTAIGKGVLFSATDGNSNTGVGYHSLYYNTTGNENTAMGRGSLYRNTNGYDNNALGYQALISNTTGFDNTATGSYALYSNTNGDANTATGSQALYNSTGNDNTADGESALGSNTSGAENTASGINALFHNTTGANNTALGADAGLNVTDGSSNTFIGMFANCGTGGHLTNSTALGASASVTTNNTVRIGNNNVTSIGGYAGWMTVSDGRMKKNIKQNVPGLLFINKLQPITYNLDLDAADKIISLPERKDKDGRVIQPSPDELTARKEKEQIVYTGFIAQDVEKAAKQLNYDFSGVDAAKNDHDLYGLRYGDFVVPLVKAVQELSTQIDSLKNNNIEMKSEIENLKSEIENIKAMIVADQSTVNGQQSTVSSASLSQNSPNPFSNTTTINYILPQRFSSAKIIISDKNGKVLKEENLSAQGKGVFSVDASTLSSGAYQYSLYLDGRLIDTKQMVLTK